MPLSQVQIRVQFFDYLFGEEEGYLCIATASPTALQTTFNHEYFEWPLAKKAVAEYVQQKQIDHHVWFCVSLLKDNTAATKEKCLPGSFIWADLDAVTPEDLQLKSVPASSIVETSPQRYQAYWRLESLLPPDIREDLSRKITYYTGADKGGWACNKLMRVPYTINHKYTGKPKVDLLHAYETRAPVGVFTGLPDPPISTDNIPLPDQPELDKLPKPENVLYKYSFNLQNTGFTSLYAVEPSETDDWSKRMWRLINVCFEAGMEADEVFSMAITAKCNKYERDNRPITYLWREVVKAQTQQATALTVLTDLKPLAMPDLVDRDLDFTNFITDYKDWAISVTDAVPEYHELSAFILLSSVLSSGLVLKASFGTLYPNLWGLVLGDSTLSRKTTAMEMALSLLRDIDKDAIVATDGSPEGLLTALSNRQEQVSVYYKDEVSGMFSAINTKSYLSDLPEVLTKMYDVPTYYSRALRKETVTVVSPYFIFFGGGIKDKVYSLIDDHYIISGFLPRFLIVIGYADLKTLRPTGPPSTESIGGRGKLEQNLQTLYNSYSEAIHTKIGTQYVLLPQTVEATMEAEAWDFFAEVETKLTTTAAESHISMLALPTLTRLGFSGLKMAVLLAASRGPNKARRVVVTKTDLQQAMWFIQKWGRYSIDLMQNAGVTKSERMVEKVITTIRNNPGCNKTYLMRVHKQLGSRDMTEVLQTIFDRGLIETKKEGKGLKFWLVQ